MRRVCERANEEVWVIRIEVARLRVGLERRLAAPLPRQHQGTLKPRQPIVGVNANGTVRHFVERMDEPVTIPMWVHQKTNRKGAGYEPIAV